MLHKEMILRLIMVSLLLYAMGRYSEARSLSREMRAYADELHLELRAVEEEHQRLEDRFAHLRDLSEIERLAREQLGYVRPGEIIFTFGEE